MYGIQNIKPLELTFDWLFDRINQEDVYMKYFGFFQPNKKFCNPLRNDNKADCWFYWHGGILYFHDPAWKQTYTCINVVMNNENCSYFKALNIVYDLFFSNHTVTNYVVTRNKEERKPKDIKVTIQPFTSTDIEYLKSYGITSEFCKKAKWYSIKHYWIDDNMMYTYNNYNPCIGYYFAGKWKLYFYKSKTYRFLSNTNKDIIQGWNMLPESGELLVITKSFKDIGTLYEQGISSIAPQAESILLSETIMTELKSRFKTIYSLMDYDNTGIHLAWKMRKLYGIKPLFFTYGTWSRKQGYEGAKDISDFRKEFGYEQTKQLIEQLR
jgi:hypothetical protein